MSKHNRANRDRYVQAGRLTPDEMARERMKQNPRFPQDEGDVTPPHGDELRSPETAEQPDAGEEKKGRGR